MELRNKTILILSPQSWGTMLISKHHYAIELAKRGNHVYFLNPPEYGKGFAKVQIRTESLEGSGHLKVVHHQTGFSNLIYFHCPFLYRILMRRHIRKILKAMNVPVEIVWSFDIGNLYPLRYFPKRSLRIFHPVDEPLTKNAILAAQHSDVIFSVTKEILKKYAHVSTPRFLINHGVSDQFFKLSVDKGLHRGLCVGFSGNLTRGDIDRSTLIDIIECYPAIEFHFWGVYDSKKSNISGNEDDNTHAFIQQLHELQNVKLHGAVSTDILVKGYSQMDLFLICYDIQKDQSRGTNYHKVMEFLSTGKPVVSNNITAFQETQDLVYMSSQRDSNNELPEIFHYVVTNLEVLNSNTLQSKRRAYAYDNLYNKQIDRIETILQSLVVQV